MANEQLNFAPDVLVVGAGFSGAVCARELAEAGFQVQVIDRREHIGGNAHDRFDEHGILIHPYGPHLFHTKAERIWQWLSRFTEWRKYEHRVLAQVDGQLLPLPINRTTINRLYNLDLDEAGIAEFLESVRQPRDTIRTSEDVVMSSVGPDLCDKFFRGYTRKQWGMDLRELKATVAKRIPTRTNDDDRYFTDSYQALPKNGYTRLFENILDHEKIDVRVNVDFCEIKDQCVPWHTIYTGPIDAFFGYRFGKLPYRSLYFEHEHYSDKKWYQPVGTVNYPNDYAFTRITEFKHITGQEHSGTSVVREYPQSEGDPYYPVPNPDNEALFQEYKNLASGLEDVTFVGRLAEYKYYNMDQAVGAALNQAEQVIKKLEKGNG